MGWILASLRGILAIAALAITALVAALAFHVLVPVGWSGPGMIGVVALLFPLHVLLLTGASAVLALLAWLARARLALVLAATCAIATIALALVPAIAMWSLARSHGVTLSLDTYREHAWHMNAGPPQPERTVVYATAADGASLELDVWLPGDPLAAGALRAAVVYVHGGAWVEGRRSSFPEWNRWLNARGYAVFDVDYRLPPPARWREEAGDVKCALRWVAAHAAEYGVDPGRIHVMGYSAGGNLALLAAYTDRDPELAPSCDGPPVRARSVIAFYAPSDLPRLYRRTGTPSFVQDALRRYIGGSPEQLPERYRALSPLDHVSPDAPPTLSLIGTHDRLVPVEQARLLHDALERAGVAQELWLLPLQDHAFDANWGGLATQFAQLRVELFLRAHDADGQRSSGR